MLNIRCSYNSARKDDLYSKKYIWQWTWILSYLNQDSIFRIKINTSIICAYWLLLIRGYIFGIGTLLTCTYGILWHRSKYVVNGKYDRLELFGIYLNIHV
jgi:hypothetical protein